MGFFLFYLNALICHTINASFELELSLRNDPDLSTWGSNPPNRSTHLEAVTKTPIVTAAKQLLFLLICYIWLRSSKNPLITPFRI